MLRKKPKGEIHDCRPTQKDIQISHVPLPKTQQFPKHHIVLLIRSCTPQNK